MKWNAQARTVLFALAFLGLFVFVNFGFNMPIVKAAAWEPVETWTFNTTDVGHWYPAETWNITLNTWHAVETWTFDTRGFHRGFSWPAHTAFYLTLYGTMIDFDDTVYFDSFEYIPFMVPIIPAWGIVFTNISMGSGNPIPSLTVSSINANMTFIAIDYLSQVRWNVTTTSASAYYIGYLWGMDDIAETQQPTTVSINGTSYSEGTYWGIVEAEWKFWTNYTVTSSSEVSFNLLWAGYPPLFEEVETWTFIPYTGSSPDLGGEGFALPLMSIFGLIGLLCMFIGPLYGIHKIRHKEYYGGSIIALIIFVIGLALFIAWLWGGLL